MKTFDRIIYTAGKEAKIFVFEDYCLQQHL